MLRLTPIVRICKQASASFGTDRSHMLVIRITLTLLFLSGAIGCSNSSHSNQTLASLESRKRHAMVISIDGLSAEFLAKELLQGRVPNIARLRSEGSYAEGVTGTYPSLTAPAHTTIVTGKLPAQHGIYTAKCFPAGHGKVRDWTSTDIRVPALWDKVNQAHLTSAAISWPLAAGAPITWDMTGVLDTRGGVEALLPRLLKWATPGMIS